MAGLGSVKVTVAFRHLDEYKYHERIRSERIRNERWVYVRTFSSYFELDGGFPTWEVDPGGNVLV